MGCMFRKSRLIEYNCKVDKIKDNREIEYSELFLSQYHDKNINNKYNEFMQFLKKIPNT